MEFRHLSVISYHPIPLPVPALFLLALAPTTNLLVFGMGKYVSPAHSPVRIVLQVSSSSTEHKRLYNYVHSCGISPTELRGTYIPVTVQNIA